jgi:hypothetical protein
MAYSPNPNREVKDGKAMVSAKELADFKEQYGADKNLRDLLNADKGLKRRDGSAPTPAPAKVSAPAEAPEADSKEAAKNLTFDPARNSSDDVADSMRLSQQRQRKSDASGETAKTNAKLEAANKLTDKDFGSTGNAQLRSAAMDTVKSIPSVIKDYASSLLKPKDRGHGTYVKDNKVVSYKKGGSVSSASSRGDGIAQRGKTKGTMR